MNKENCGVCGLKLQAGSSWIVRCKDALSNPRTITCPIGAKMYICSRCAGETTTPQRHPSQLWKTPVTPSSRLRLMAKHRGNGGVMQDCTLQISPLIRNAEFTVSFGSLPGGTVGIPAELVSGKTPDFMGIWKLLKGDKMNPRYTYFTVGGGGSDVMAPASDAVFRIAEGQPGLATAGNKSHFHVGVTTHSGKGTTERVWYNLTGTTLKFSNILDG